MKIEIYESPNKEDPEEARMKLARAMKMPKTLTYPKEGTAYGDLPYASWEKFQPAHSKK